MTSPFETEPTTWWRDAVVYQIYPRSFADANGDGVGDLRGIIQRLDHISDLGVDAVWVSPFYVSPMADAGYDVADYRNVDPIFGTLEDAEELIAEVHARGLRLVIDLVPNHTSDEHPWFRAALSAAPGAPERSRYIFRDGRGVDGEEPPNNWTSMFGGPAWTRTLDGDGRPGQWFLHLFDSRQPDLDWNHPDVHQEFLDILRFWLDRGVDGFRVDVANMLVKEPGLPDWDPMLALEKFGQEDAPVPPMWDQDGVHDVYRDWRRLLDSYEPAGSRVMVAEAWVEPPSRLARYVRPDEMHQAFNFNFLGANWEVASLRDAVDRSMAANEAVGAPTTWVLSNHDVVRHATRFATDQPGSYIGVGIGPRDPQPDSALGLRRARAATALMLALPGSAYLYQGEELGLPEHTTLADQFRQDPTWTRTGGAIVGRDGCRIPLPWQADAPALGFNTTGAAWLPQPASYAALTVDQQRVDDDSTLAFYRRALEARRTHDLGRGELTWIDGPEPEVLRMIRHTPTAELMVIMNLGLSAVEVPAGHRIVLTSGSISAADDKIAPQTTAWVLPTSR